MENDLKWYNFAAWSSKYGVDSVKLILEFLREKLAFIGLIVEWLFGDPKDIFAAGMTYLEKEYLSKDIIYQMKFLGINFAAVHRPEDIKALLNKNSCLKKSIFYAFLEHSFGQGMVTSGGELWKSQRRVLTPAFQPQTVERLLPTFVAKNKALMCKLETSSDTGNPVDLWEHLISTNLDIGWDNVIGMDCEIISHDEKKEFEHAVLRALEIEVHRISKIWMHHDVIFNFYAKLNGYTKIFESVKQVPNKVIAHKRKLREMDVHKKNEERSFLDRILDANEEEKLFSDKLIRDQIVTLIFASSETTAIASCFTLLMLAMNQNIQEKVYEEIVRVIGADSNVEIKQLGDLVYLEQCINETLRLFPPVPIFGRHSKEPMPLNNCTLPARSQIGVCPFLIHRSTRYYSNPLKWDPDNFTAEECEKRSAYSFLPFSRGPRMCIGARYAMMSMKISLSLILRQFKVTTDVKFDQIELYMDSIIRSAHGFPMRIHSRKKLDRRTI